MKLCNIASLCLAVVVVVTLTGLPGVPGVRGQVPIPSREVGFVYKNGAADAPIKLDIFIDLICPDSQEAMPHVLEVADHYGPHNLRLRTHLFPLPYLRNGFYAAKAAHVLQAAGGGDTAYDWINTVFDNMDLLRPRNTHNLSDANIVTRLWELTSAVGVDMTHDQFANLVDSRTVETDARIAWKYACTRGVAEVPTFLVNDVVAPALQSWSLADWRGLIDPLLNSTATATSTGNTAQTASSTGQTTGKSPSSSSDRAGRGESTVRLFWVLTTLMLLL